MKILPTIFLIVSFFPSFSQNWPGDINEIDRKIRSIPFTTTDSLANQLIALGNTDLEKVRAIFRWITENINYNTRIFNRNREKPFGPVFNEEPDDSSATLKPLNERVAEKVLRKKIAFCDGYTRLFKILCDRAGIQSEIITGYARTNKPGARFGVNHTWNAVYLDSSWRLLDVTWASGFISYSDEFIRRYDEYYFLTPPQHFIRDHYPEDLKWTLLSDPPAFREFYNGPFLYSAFIKSGITSYLPVKGIIEASVGDTIRIELKTKTLARNYFVADELLTDSLAVFFQPDIEAGEKISYTYTVATADKEWLYIYYNDEVVMRYKLKMKKEKADLAIRNKFQND
jgi:transglutaminase/protease-like cytokinesis protein 3